MQLHIHCSNYTMRFYGKLKDSSPVGKEAGTQAGGPLLLEAPDLKLQLAGWDYHSWTSVHPRGGGEQWPTPSWFDAET